MQKVLIIAPHGDDEVLGFGGAISRHIEAGDIVGVCFLKKPYCSRSNEQYLNSYKAQNILKYTERYDLNIIPENLSNFCFETLQKIENMITEYKPTTLYIPNIGDTHQDHISTINLIRIATRIHGPAKVSKILCGEIISSSNCSFNSSNTFNPNYFISLTEYDIELKIKALECYSGEIKPYPHPRSAQGIRTYAQMRGMEAGCLYAEAFQCVRQLE